MDLRIPKIREDSYFPALPEPRRRSERAALAEQHGEWAEGRRYITFRNDVATEVPQESGGLRAAD